MRRRGTRVAVLGLLVVAAGCDLVDRVRDREVVVVDTSGTSATAGGLTLRLQAPGVLRPGGEGIVTVSLTNRGDTVARDARLDLLVPGWLEPAPPRPGEPPVTMSASAEEGIRLSYRLADPPLEPGQTRAVEQRVRLPGSSPIRQGAVPGNRLVRARLLSPRGEPLAEVESEVLVDTLSRADAPGPRTDAGAAADRDRLGPVRLGMTAAALRQAAPGARDTTWTQEGMRERGLLVPLEGGGRAVALLVGDTVARIVVRDPAPRTREGLGVGSSLAELRDAYGRACLAVGEGEVVAWFPAAPGVSFALDAAVPQNPTRETLERIPATARVSHWWLRRGTDACP